MIVDEKGNLLLNAEDIKALVFTWGLIVGAVFVLGFLLGWWLM